MALGVDERTYNDAQKRQQYSLLSTIEKIRRHHIQPGPSNRQYPDYNFNPPRVTTPPPRVPSPPPVHSPSVLAIQPEIRSRDTESIDNDVAPDIASTYQSGSKNGTQRSHAFGSSLQAAFRPSAETNDTTTLSQSDNFQDQVMLELCNDKYYHIPREVKMDLIETLLEEHESDFLQSQITVNQFVKLFLERYNSEQKERRTREFQALKRGLKTRETYSRIVRNKKDTRTNSTLNK